MCQFSEAQLHTALEMMLDRDPLTYFSSKQLTCEEYPHEIHILTVSYTSNEKRSRTFTAWKGMTLSKSMATRPDNVDEYVFRGFIARLMPLQKQMDSKYYTDTLLWDRLLITVDIPTIQSVPRDRMPRTSHQAVNPVANQLSEQPNLTGSTSI